MIHNWWLISYSSIDHRTMADGHSFGTVQVSESLSGQFFGINSETNRLFYFCLLVFSNISSKYFGIQKIFARINFETNQLVIFFVGILKWYVPNYFSKAVNSISKLHYEIRFFHKHKMPSLQNRKLLLIESKTKTN